MPSRFGLLVEGALVLGVLMIWGVIALTRPEHRNERSNDLGTQLYHSLGLHGDVQ